MVAIPIASVVGLTALAYAGFVPFTSGQPLSSTAMNNNFAALQSQITALQAAVGVGADGGAPTISIPSGTVVAFAGPVAKIPAGWVLCDGTLYNYATNPKYTALYEAIGISSGGTVSLSEFNVPDYRGYFLRGLDSTASGANDPSLASRTAASAGGNTGANVGTLEADGFASHAHGVSDPGHTHSIPAYQNAAGPNWGLNNLYNQVAGGIGPVGLSTSATGITIQDTGGAETRPKNVTVNYIIKL